MSTTTIVPRAEARKRGLTRFFTGVPCRNGHVAERLASDGNCIECKRIADRINAKKPHARRRQLAYEREYTKRPDRRPKERAHASAGRAAILQATPRWLTREQKAACLAVYIEAARLTKETGILHEVDNIVPLRGKDVCGLHVSWNLRAIPSRDNRSKSNKVVAEMLQTSAK